MRMVSLAWRRWTRISQRCRRLILLVFLGVREDAGAEVAAELEQPPALAGVARGAWVGVTVAAELPYDDGRRPAPKTTVTVRSDSPELLAALRRIRMGHHV
ncbi:hypothetical protein [Streptomyces sp. WAC08241]|uniref:hypothetical protein n=1 Tax=Streptomyces sp. WAC08241 TaxID=2487421 RepID=UPI000F799E1A|nr:hypothetical protein [Streptomyces sp. WAC08241]RSS39054.1 hypothetical protein EF906_19705 [Streptomyces sp. WAC08241]